MIPKHVIEKAIKGGVRFIGCDAGADWILNNRKWEELAVDPLFWQSLGKELGWVSNWGKEVNNDNPNHWFQFAHLYFDLLLTGGDTEKFWNDLIKLEK